MNRRSFLATIPALAVLPIASASEEPELWHRTGRKFSEGWEMHSSRNRRGFKHEIEPVVSGVHPATPDILPCWRCSGTRPNLSARAYPHVIERWADDAYEAWYLVPGHYVVVPR